MVSFDPKQIRKGLERIAMRIAILNMTGGGLSGGYRKYLINILPRMAGIPEVEAILCVSPETLHVHDWFGTLTKVEFAGCRPFRPWRECDPILHRRLEVFAPDVIFIPMERHVWFGDVPVVNMLRNMLPLISIAGNLVSERIRNRIQRFVARKAVERSDRVIAVSRYVKEYICNHWSVPFGKVGLVYHGIDSDDSLKCDRPQSVPGDWDDRFLFTAGSIDPYRGLEDLLLASKELVMRGEEVKVVVAGNARPAMSGYREKLGALAAELGVAANIRWVGYLEKEEMSWCYRNCRAFVMTSRVEACPNIALEAMAHGSISICANNDPLPEFFSDSAIYYAPSDGRSLAASIRIATGLDSGARERYSSVARDRAVQFTWDRTTRRTIEELKSAIVEKRLQHI